MNLTSSASVPAASAMHRTGGIVAILLLILVVGGVAGMYYAYQQHLPNYYLILYDGKFVRYLDVPPFSKRLGPASDDKKGECMLEINITSEQSNAFLVEYCKKKGFVFKSDEKGFTIDVAPDYVIKGTNCR